jgi:hypothetical protein
VSFALDVDVAGVGARVAKVGEAQCHGYNIVTVCVI